MSELNKFVDFVKAQAEFHARMAKKHSAEPRRHDLHSNTSSSFEELHDFLASLASQQNKKATAKLSLGWDEIADLPEELVAELSISDADRTEFVVLQAIEDVGGIASLDRILVEYYKLTGEVMKRAQMNNRIYRMIQKGMLHAVPGKKGIYSIEPVAEEEAGIFG
ncbi:MAG: hypothetical protein KUL88_18510 [Rhizobium sp.]|nr:hypothetical protein [Rhizobium sp.]